MNFLKLKRCVSRLQQIQQPLMRRRIAATKTMQKFWRGHVARCHVHIECYAILSLQSLFRGHLVRRSTSAKVTAMRHRIARATAAATEEMKIGNRNRVALQMLLTSKALSNCIKACHELQTATHLSDVCCFKLCQQGAEPSLFELIHS
jgi:hypothetical protein